MEVISFTVAFQDTYLFWLNFVQYLSLSPLPVTHTNTTHTHTHTGQVGVQTEFLEGSMPTKKPSSGHIVSDF